MPQLVKKLRSGWAVLAAGALVASLLAVGTAPAGAAEIKTGDDNKAEPSEEADFSACVGGALDDAGFTDLGSLEAAVDDINCLAYYGITQGKTADTFDPNSSVTRSQMALFLHRAATAAGMDLMGGDVDADFGDIADLGEDRQAAIKALASNGILAGRGDMAFDPLSDITRAEMAVALVSLVRHASPGLFNQNGTLKIDTSDVDHFADARAAVPVAVDNAISYAYELGITTGYDDATFRPSASVPRRNMASFVVRALAHTNTRPAGVTAQVIDGDSVMVSVRTADFEPVANAAVDAFAVATTRSSEAFDSDGECTRLVRALGGNSTCEIDDQDEITDADGQAELLVPVGDIIGGLARTGAVVWTWSGDDGDEVDSSTDLYELDVPPTPPKVTASSADISSDLHKAARQAGFGDTVTYTVQLQGLLGGDDVDSAPDKNGASYSLKATYAINGRTTVEEVEIGDDGSATFSLTHSDPNPDEGGNTATINYELSAMKNSKGVWAPDCDGGTAAGCIGGDPDNDDDRSAEALSDIDDTDIADNPDTSPADESRTARPESFTGSIVFSDAAPVATTVVAMADAYDFAPGTNRSVSAYVTVAVLDQYGSGVRGVPVYLADYDAGGTNDETTGSTEEFLERARHTVSSGATRVRFDAGNLDTGIQTIQAIADVANNGVVNDSATAADETADDISSVIPDPANAGEFLAAATTIYWVSDGGDIGTGTVVQGDLDNNELVVQIAAAYRLVNFDSGDQFEVLDETDDTSTDADIQCARSFGLDAFIDALGGDSDLDDDADGAVSVNWTGYSADDSAVVVGWTVTIESATAADICA